MTGGDPADAPGAEASPALLDDLAGVVDLFGAVTRSELSRALDELAYKAGSETDAGALADAVDDALREYYLVAYEPPETDGTTGDEPEGTGKRDGEVPADLLTVGPVAFPSLPPNAEDLPHILDVPDRTVDRERVAAQVESRLRADAARAVDRGDDARVEHLLDVTYDLEAWATVDVETVRERLDAALSEADGE